MVNQKTFKFRYYKNLKKLLQIYRTYKTGKTVCTYLPLRLWLEPTDRCNLTCPFCINRLISPSRKGDLDFGLFKRIIDQLEGKICDINLFHRGEPLMHPKLADMVSYAGRKGLTTRIHTNATLLTREFSNALLQNGLSYISFSFDGFNKEDYEKNRAGARYDQTLLNILNFLRLKKEKGANTPYTVLQVITANPHTKEFITEKNAFLKKFQGLPLDKLSIRTPHNWAGGIPTHRGATDKTITCTFPWYGLTILWNGKAVICCQDYEGEMTVGDATAHDLKTIWNSEQLQKIRNDFYKKQYNCYSPCQKCDRIRRPGFLGIPKEYIGTFIREARIRK